MIEQLIGKNFTIALKGKQRTIGQIESAVIDKERTRLEVTVELTDEEVAGMLGAAQDKYSRENPRPAVEMVQQVISGNFKRESLKDVSAAYIRAADGAL